MFGWLVDAWRRRRRRKSRAVFRFFDGRRTRAVDPWKAYVDLHTHPKFTFDMAVSIDEGDREDTEIAAAAAAEVFGVTRFQDDEQFGLTDGELVELLMSFSIYVADAKKKYDSMLASLAATDGEPSNVFQKTNDATGGFSSDSGSTSPPRRPAMRSASSAV